MYTTAEDWLDRFAAAGCLLTIDDAGMLSPGRDNPSEACAELWAELQGPENLQKWMEVTAGVKTAVGSFVGSTSYPPRSK